jgi:hypothetical protein
VDFVLSLFCADEMNTFAPKRQRLIATDTNCRALAASETPLLTVIAKRFASLAYTYHLRPCARRRLKQLRDQKRGARAGPPLAGAPGITRGFIGSRPSRCIFLRASLRARRMASAFSRTLFSEGFS